MKLTPLLFVGALCVAAPAAFAGPNAELMVKGTIKPAGCTFTLNGGGQFDFGTITPQQLPQKWANFFTSSPQQLSITCPQPTRFALRGFDLRESLATGAGYRAGTIADQSIGHFVLKLPASSVAADGSKDIYAVGKTPRQTSWRPANWDYIGPYGAFIWNRNEETRFARQGSTDPLPMRSFSADLDAVLRLRGAELLDVGEDVQIDGAAMIELVYL
ncbi:DUF1120 domain-containing protein [Pseudomonas sp. B21-032]|uniref:DUF1120 domain-containing protein n=1 Tax=Pseudomonas sp. B21-032 TaxID=2895483 RepID=UPI0021600320|nr:DUF1120 domain-containing protein [Pseudomonas sp. B21-032]UVL62792.1 DUF1120 domain-containing protein [Pseudomonas sp. B21-032]